MKKRIAVFLLILVLTAALLPQTPVEADSSHLVYVSVGDRLLLGYVPYFYSSSLYLPLAVFQELGMTYTADMAASTFIVKYGGAELIFDLQNGESYDSAGNSYGAKAIYVAGSVYLPVYSVSAYFGVIASFINGNGNGDVIRLKTGNAAYSDDAFLEAATPTLERETRAYYAASATPVPSAAPTPSPTPKPTPSPTPTPDRSTSVITLSFVGAPTPEILDTLDKYDFPAIFFLTHEDVTADPSALRRAVGTGHRLGVWLEEGGQSPQETARLIYDAARVRTVFFSCGPELAEEAALIASGESMIFVLADFDVAPDAGVLDPSPLLLAQERIAVRLYTGSAEHLPELLEFIKEYKFTVEPMLETTPQIVAEQDE